LPGGSFRLCPVLRPRTSTDLASLKRNRTSVPHPFDFFLSKGWETTHLNSHTSSIRFCNAVNDSAVPSDFVSVSDMPYVDRFQRSVTPEGNLTT
jgi:hypothetical protein